MTSPHWAMTLHAPLLVGAAVVLMALGLRLAYISGESLEGDEVFSYRVATSDLPRALELIREDLVHPPLYYLLLKATLPRADRVSALRLRALSLAAGVATVALVLLIGWIRPTFGGPALLSALLLAWNGTHLFYSQQARSYALFGLLVGGLLVWSLLLDRYLERVGYWLGGAGLMAALLYTHYFAIFYCVALVLPVLLSDYPARVKVRSAGCLAAGAAALAPWVYREAAVYDAKSGLSSNLGWQGLASAYELKLTFAHYLGVPDVRGGTTAAALVVAALAISALGRRPSAEGAGGDARLKMSLALMASVPAVAFMLTRWPFRLPVFAERHVVASIVAILLLVSSGLWSLAERVRRPRQGPLLGLGASVLIALAALPVWQAWPGPFRMPAEAAAGWLQSHAPQVPVYTTYPYGIGEPVSFYLRGSRRVEGLPAEVGSLPERCIVLFRPGKNSEAAAVESLLDRFVVAQEKEYRAPATGLAMRLLLLEEPAASPAR